MYVRTDGTTQRQPLIYKTLPRSGSRKCQPSGSRKTSPPRKTDYQEKIYQPKTSRIFAVNESDIAHIMFRLFDGKYHLFNFS